MSGILQALFMKGGSTAAWSFKSVGAAGTGTNPTAALPASHGAGDLLVIVGVGVNTTFTTPAGWTAASFNNTTSKPRLEVFYKFDSGSESNVTLTGGSSTSHVVMLCWTGGTAVDVASTLNSAGLATNSLTTTAANDLIISVYALDVSAATWTGTPASTNVRYNGGGIASTDPLLVVDEIQVAAGASTSRTATSGSTTSPNCAAISFKL